MEQVHHANGRLHDFILSKFVRRDFFLQSSANVLTNALCAVIENPGDFQARARMHTANT